jgi:hypothetical protein
MQQIEPTNLCASCQKQAGCFNIGISERETCIEYEAQSMEGLLAKDKFVQDVMVGHCPKCGGEHTYDCENNRLLEDNTVAHCLDCETYWCLECGYRFETNEKRIECPHWDICCQCSIENGYLNLGELIDNTCPRCNHYNDGCQLEDHSQCEFICPYDCNIAECPKIEEFLESTK